MGEEKGVEHVKDILIKSASIDPHTGGFLRGIDVICLLILSPNYNSSILFDVNKY